MYFSKLIKFPNKGTFDFLIESEYLKFLKLDDKIKLYSANYDLNKFNLICETGDDKLLFCFYFDWFPHIRIITVSYYEEIINHVLYLYKLNLIDKKIKWINLSDKIVFDFCEIYGKL